MVIGKTNMTVEKPPMTAEITDMAAGKGEGARGGWGERERGDGRWEMKKGTGLSDRSFKSCSLRSLSLRFAVLMLRCLEVLLLAVAVF
jgi:hypothetical protein